MSDEQRIAQLEAENARLWRAVKAARGFFEFVRCPESENFYCIWDFQQTRPFAKQFVDDLAALDAEAKT